MTSTMELAQGHYDREPHPSPKLQLEIHSRRGGRRLEVCMDKMRLLEIRIQCFIILFQPVNQKFYWTTIFRDLFHVLGSNQRS